MTAHKEVEYRRVHARGQAVGLVDSIHEIIGSNPIVMQFFHLVLNAHILVYTRMRHDVFANSCIYLHIKVYTRFI